MNQSYPRVSCLLLALALATFTNLVSTMLGSRFVHEPEAVYSQRAILSGQPTLVDGQPVMYPQFYNRLLFPTLFLVVDRLHILGQSQSYLLLRYLNALALFLVFLWVARRALHADFRTAVAGAGLLAYTLVFTFNHGWEVSSDYFDGIFMCLFVMLALERKRLTLFAVVLLSSFNRESCVFAGVVWFALYGVSRSFRIQWREALYASLLSISSYALAIGIRVAILGRAIAMGPDAQGVVTPAMLWEEVRIVIHHPTPVSWPVLIIAMLIPVFFWIRINQEYVREPQARLLIAAGVLWLMTSFLAHMWELRVYAPVLTILVVTCTWLETLRPEGRYPLNMSPSTDARANAS